MTETTVLVHASAMSRYLPLIGVALLILIALVVRPIVQHLRHGGSGVFLFRSDNSAQMARDVLLVLLFVGLIAQAVLAARRPAPLSQLLVYTGPLHDLLQAAGAVLLIGGIAVFALAELQLGSSWRIGIEEGVRPGLVTHGLYRWSRHPIFLGVLLALTGYAALLPTPVSLLLLLGAFIGFRAQAIAEEAHMLRLYGDAYRSYTASVGRFVSMPAKR